MHTFDRRTDRQTERQTDRQTGTSLVTRPPCIQYSAVKTKTWRSSWEVSRGRRKKNNITEDHLGRRLGRQPEDDERQEGEQKARYDEDVGVEYWDALDLDVERQIRTRRATARLVPRLLRRRMFDYIPFVALHVVTYVYLPIRFTVATFTAQVHTGFRKICTKVERNRAIRG